MRAEELVAGVAPAPPGSLRIARRSHLGVEVEHATLPVEQVELVHGPTLAVRQRLTASGSTEYQGVSQSAIGSHACATRPAATTAGRHRTNATTTPVAMRPEAR